MRSPSLLAALALTACGAPANRLVATPVTAAPPGLTPLEDRAANGLTAGMISDYGPG